MRRGCQGLLGPANEAGTARDGALFADVPVDECARRLRDDGICVGLRLPPQQVAELDRLARASPCGCRGCRMSFRIDDVVNGRLRDGSPVPVADVITPQPCRAMQRIARDAGLVEAVSRYLGYRPARIATRLYWSPRSDLSDETRRALGQTIDFHYDIEGLNAVYAYFYITPADRASGAHVAVRASHRRKPLRMILSSCFQPEAAVRAHYGDDRTMVIEGPRGFGFLEAAECFHKALPPVAQDRLMLQIRYW